MSYIGFLRFLPINRVKGPVFAFLRAKNQFDPNVTLGMSMIPGQSMISRYCIVEHFVYKELPDLRASYGSGALEDSSLLRKSVASSHDRHLEQGMCLV